MNVARLGGMILLAMAMAAPARAQDQATVEVTVARANIRAAASESSKVLAQVTRGTDLDLIAVEGDWYHVKVPVSGLHVTAYISRKVSRMTGGSRGLAGSPMVSAPHLPSTMVAAPTGGATTVPPPMMPAAPVPPPNVPVDRSRLSVALAAPNGTTALVPRSLRVVQVAGKLDSLAKAAPLVPATGNVSGAAGDQSAASFVWMADGPGADRVVDSRRPVFVVTYQDVPGVSSDDFLPVIVRMTPAASGVRLVGMLRGRADESVRTESDWDVVHDMKQDLMKVTMERLDAGSIRITPAVDLQPGQYAVALRLSAKDKLSGSTLLGADAEGRIFALCWDFEVK